VKVLHTDLRIVYYHDEDAEEAGRYVDFPSPTLRINTAYSQETQARTKIHEYFHALYRLVHDPDADTITEEEAVRLFEGGVDDLCKQNWKELEALRKD
jgi:hypothetical protein